MSTPPRPQGPLLPLSTDAGNVNPPHPLQPNITSYIDQAVREACTVSQLRGTGQTFQNFNSISALTTTYSGATKDGACRHWIHKLETAFKLAGDGGMTDETKISYSSLRTSLTAGSWSQFKQKLIARFDFPSEYAEGKLRSIRQDDRETLENYYTRFQLLAANCYEDMDQWPQSLYLYLVQGMTEGSAKDKVFEKLSERQDFCTAIESVINLEKFKAAFYWDSAAATAFVPKSVKKREDGESSSKKTDKLDKLAADVSSLTNQLGSLHLLMQESAKASARAPQTNYSQRQPQHRYRV